MEPRELWERNTLLAEAFCSTNDRVREAQAVMDEAVASRTRALAAFAVTVGSDGAVADLMGLNEREVRIARRTVGKEDARAVADQLLSALVEPPAPLMSPVPDPVWEPLDDTMPAHVPHQRPETGSPAHPPAVESATMDAPVTWTPGMDSVLQWSCQSGLDLQTVAEELGLNSKDLLLRAQMLAAEGRLMPNVPAYDANRSGRHRRHGSLEYTPVPDSPESLYSSPGPYG